MPVRQTDVCVHRSEEGGEVWATGLGTVFHTSTEVLASMKSSSDLQAGTDNESSQTSETGRRLFHSSEETRFGQQG